MGDNFDCGGGEQNIAQGNHAIGKQVNNHGPETETAGNQSPAIHGRDVTVTYHTSIIQKPAVIAALLILVAALIGGGVLYWYKPVPQPQPNVQSHEQNIAQGDHATGKVVNNHGPVISTTGDQSPAVNAQTVTITYNSFSPDVLADVRKLAVTDAALTSFFKILEQAQVAPNDLDSKLREIAFRHKELLLRFEAVTSDDPQVKTLKGQAGQAIENGEYDLGDALLDQIDERHNNAIHQLHKIQAETAARLEKEQFGKAENLVSRARLQRLQYRYEKSAQYWQEAAAALPEGRKVERAEYLGAAGQDLYDISRYAEALRLDEQSLSISRELGDRNSEATSLNNISLIYNQQGDYDKAFDYQKQGLDICRELGSKKCISVALNNIATISSAKGDYLNALKYLEQSLLLRRELHDKKGESTTINNIGVIYDEKGDHVAALRYYQEALSISYEIKDRDMESKCLNNISLVHEMQGKLDAALEHSEQSLVISQQIGDRRGEGMTLNNIAAIYEDKGDYPDALKQYEQALSIAKEIGNKEGEATASANIGVLYAKQGELAKAEPYLRRAVELMEQLEHPVLEKARRRLEDVRAKLRGKGALQ